MIARIVHPKLVKSRIEPLLSPTRSGLSDFFTEPLKCELRLVDPPPHFRLDLLHEWTTHQRDDGKARLGC